MSIEHGIVVGGQYLPSTSRVLRDSDAWWEDGDLGTRSRKGHRAERLVGHWTAGHAKTGVTSGRSVVRAMKARLSKTTGKPLDVGVHFVIGWDGLIFQTCDLLPATVHVGHRPTILSSIGVEHCWPGTMTQARKLGMDGAVAVRGVARGAAVKACAPSDELLEAWRWLVTTLTSADHPILAIPMRRGSETAPGILEHMDMSGSKKLDAAGLLVAALGL